MRDLSAQVTSSLLQFPEVTTQALGEDEITLGSVLSGKFSGGRNGLAWLACGPQLEVVSSVTGERRSAYRFRGVKKQPPTIRVVKDFSWQKRTGLLVGLEEAEGSVLCLYDLGISRVVKAVVLPGRVTAIEPITNHGGPSVSTRHLHQSLRWLFGVAAVATDVGHLLLVDLCLDDFSCSQNEIEASGLEVVTRIPAEVPQRREAVTREGRHLCFQLQNPSGTAISTLYYISRSNQLVVGFSDGCLSLWNMKTLKREHHSQLEGGRIPVYAVTFQEPENDPRNCCYLWAVQSTQDSEGDVVSLHLLQLAFGDRKRLAPGQVMYEGLEYCVERYSLGLTGGVFPLSGQASDIKLLSCQTVEKLPRRVDGEDSVSAVISPDTSVSLFSWQVNTCGQGKASAYLGVFDINRWYHAQMPDSLRPEELLHDCPYFALWSLDAVISMTSPNPILDILVHERSLSRGVALSHPPPEQFFHPSSYNFDGTCLLNSGVVRMTCIGFQKEALNFLKKRGPLISEAIHDSYNRCLVAGLLSPTCVDVQPSSLSQEEQLEAVLSAAVQTGSLELLTGCIKHWASEAQPSSAANLQFVLEWTWKKVIYAKDEFDQICVPLFDGSRNFVDPQTLQSLQHCQLLLSNLSTVLTCFLTEAQELTEKGFTDLTNKQVVTGLLSLYARVVIWFCRSSLLPEGLDDDARLGRPFYNYPLIQSYYTGHRQKLERLSRGKWDSDCLMIDGMVSQLGDQVEKLWRRDEGGTGKYPPASLHALLDLYLLEGIEESYKHAITIYLLLDIMHSFPNKTETSVDSFPTAFAIPWGLVKLVEGFWLLDHNDYENSLALLFHPATIKTVSWQHRRIIQSLMCQGERRRALGYIQMMKPAMSSSSEVRLFLTVLLSNRCVVEAWGLLQQHATRLNIKELLKHVYEICQEMGLMEDLLQLPFTGTEQECLEKILQSNAAVRNLRFPLDHHVQRANYIPALQSNRSMNVNLTNDREPGLRERAVARNSTLHQCGKILPRVHRKLARERAKPYHLPSSVSREVARAKPLSTVTKQANAGNVRTRATFISNVLSKIGEVGVGNEQKTSCSHRDRLLDLVVRPVPSTSAAQGGSWQSPCGASTSFTASSPLKSNMLGCTSQKNFSRASELNLLETPLVVKNDREPGLRERAVARNSTLDQYGKTLPRVQRKLAVERAKPYHLPSSVSREVARPKPLSTVTKQANAGNVRTRATFISNVLSKIGEVGVGNEQKTSCSHRDRLLDLVVRPVPSTSAAQGGSWQSPCGASTSFTASSPLKSNMLGCTSQKNFSRASELNLLETPLVVKNDREPGLRERAVARNSTLDQYGKTLPRVQRKLAVERAKPYHLPSSVSREVARPKPLSTVTKQANAGNVRTRATFISNVLSKIGEVGVGNEQKTSCSHRDRLLDLVVRPVPSTSAAQGGSWQSPCGASTSFTASSPLKSNMLGCTSQKNFSRASELNLLETPLVVKNDREPGLRERAVARNSTLDQYGKTLPRVQRKLAVERAKPYHLPSSVSREVARPKPLSTVTKQANAGNVRTRATFISNVLSKIGEVGVGNEQKTSCSHRDRLLDLVVRPVPSTSAAQGGSWQSPCGASTSFTASSPLKSNMLGCTSQKNFSRASELNLLETPLVVKNDREPGLRERAVARNSTLDQYGKTLPRVQRKLAVERAKPYHLPSSVSREVARPKPLSTVTKVLATAASGFPAFTPRSILRSSLGTTPLATPSASPGRSLPPPLRAKERRVSFREENLNAKWTVGVTEDNKAPSGVSSEHHHGAVEDAWSESRDKPTLFPLSNPEEGGAEVEESGDGLEKTDVSKENSNFSARSDQAALEYRDAKSPGNFEDEVIFIAANPANSSTEETADFEELEKEEDSEIVEEKPFPMEQPDSSELRKATGFVEESNADRLTLPEDGKWLFKAAEAATSGTASEGEANQQESKMSSSSEEKAIPVATNPQLSESLQAEGESVIRILDSEEVASTHSENCLEGKRVDFPEERNPEAAGDEGNVPFPQEEVTVSNNLPKTEEINVIGDGAVKAQTSEEAPETSPYSELHPSGNLQYSYDTTEQQFACHLPDNRDGECDAAEGDGELFLSQCNFTFVLEGEEGEAEMGDPTLVDASKAAGTTTEEKPVNSLGNTENQEHVTNSVSTVTSDQASQNIAESLPYVPEPIKAAIAENLPDAIKDTRSKEFTSEVAEQSIHETIGKKVTGFQKAKAPLRTVPEGVEDETSVRQVEYGIAPRTRARGQLSRSLSTPSAGTQQLLKTGKPGLFALSPRRSTRRTKEAPETSSLQTEENAQEEQTLVMPVTPRRGRKPKPSTAEKVESSLSDGQTLSLPTQSVAATPRRRLRRAKEAAAELLGEANEETCLAEGSIIASATSQRTRGGKSSAGGQETGQTDTGHKIKTSVSPSRSARKLKSVNLQFMENIVKAQEVRPSAQLLLPVATRRGRKRKMSSSEVSENSDLDLSKSSLPQTEFKLPVTPRRRARKRAQNLLADTESLSAQKDTCAGGKVGMLDTPKRRIRGVPHAKLEKTDAPEQRAAQPNEESSTPRTTVGTGRRGRKRRLALEESTEEEAFPQGPGGSPMMLE